VKNQAAGGPQGCWILFASSTIALSVIIREKLSSSPIALTRCPHFATTGIPTSC